MASNTNEMIYFKLLNEKKQEEKSFTRELPPIRAAEHVDYCTPEVFWYQTETTVRVSVKLTNTSDCRVSLTKNRILNFR